MALFSATPASLAQGSKLRLSVGAGIRFCGRVIGQCYQTRDADAAFLALGSHVDKRHRGVEWEGGSVSLGLAVLQTARR